MRSDKHQVRKDGKLTNLSEILSWGCTITKGKHKTARQQFTEMLQIQSLRDKQKINAIWSGAIRSKTSTTVDFNDQKLAGNKDMTITYNNHYTVDQNFTQVNKKGK